MAKRRTTKGYIHAVCTDLWAECVAVSLYVAKPENYDVETMLRSIIKIEKDYISRVSHVEPGIKAKAYFKDLRSKFTEQVNEIIDQVNNLI